MCFSAIEKGINRLIQVQMNIAIGIEQTNEDSFFLIRYSCVDIEEKKYFPIDEHWPIFYQTLMDTFQLLDL